jgi:hypothetical protein
MIKWSSWIKYYYHIDCEEVNENGEPKISDERFLSLVEQLQYNLRTHDLLE